MVYHISGGNGETSVQGPLVETLTPIDGDRDKVELLDPSPDGRWGVSFKSGGSGRPVDGTHMPTRLRRKRVPDNKGFPIDDVRNIWGGGLLVCAAFKDVVERFEPGVHQFFPVTVEQGGKVQFERFIFYICNRLDALAKDECVPPVGEDEHWMPAMNKQDRCVFSVEKIGSHHAWHDKYTIGTFVSDALHEALTAANLSGLGGKYYEQV